MDHDALVALVDRAAAANAPVEAIQRAQEEVSDLFAAHQDRAFGLAYRFVGDVDRAEMLTLDAVAIGYRRLGEWRGVGSFWSWLYGILRERCLKHLSRKRGLLTADGVLIPGSEIAKALAPMRRETWQELLRRVGEDVLTADEQQTVYLRYVEGLEPSEINAVMGLEGTGARGLLQRSRHKLGLALRARQLKVYGGRSDHPTFGELEVTEPNQAVRSHLKTCPMCRVDRRRVRSPLRMKARQLEGIRPSLAGARVLASGVLPTSWRSATGAGPIRADAKRLALVHRRTLMGRYRMTGFVKRHGMSVVYRARDRERRTQHLVQVLATTDGHVTARVKRNRRSLSSLRHPNVVSIVDDGVLAESPAFVTDFVNGPAIDELLESVPALPWDQVDAFAIDVLCGLDAAHASGHVHGQLTPSNVLLDSSGEHLRARIAGFGVIDALGVIEGGGVFGHPSYMAPEQVDDPSRGDARSDVFVVGALLYELATGQRCFSAPTHAEVIQRVQALTYVPPGQLRPDLPERMEGAIEACLKADPDARPKTAGALLDLWTRGGGRTTRPLTSLGEGQAAAIESLRAISALPEPEEATDADNTTTFGRMAVVDPGPSTTDGALAAFLAVGAIGLLAAGVVWWTMSGPQSTSSWRLARQVPRAIDPCLSTDGRSVLFSDQRDIYVVAVEGHTAKNLTEAFPPPATGPVWSPDGTQIAFVAQRSVWVMRADGSQPMILATPGFEPAWSPDGKTVAFVTSQSPPRQQDAPRPSALHLLDVASSEITAIRPDVPDGPRHPTWSADGSRLAWGTSKGIEVGSAAGGTAVSLPSKGAQHPVWRSDGSIAALCDDGSGHGGVCLWTEGTGGWTGPREWVALPHPARSFDTMASQMVVGMTQPVGAVMEIDLTEGTYDVVSPTDQNMSGVSVSDDGRWLATTTHNTLMLRGPDGRWRTILEAQAVNTPSWRPRGGVTFGGQVNGRRGVYEIEVDGTGLVRISDLELKSDAPVFWAPDGRSLAWTYDAIPVVVDPGLPWAPQISSDAIGLDGVESGPFSPEGERLLLRVDRDTFTVVDLSSGTSLGQGIRASSAAWSSSDTLVLGDESVLFRYDLNSGQRVALGDLRPWSVAAHPAVSMSPTGSIFVSVQRDEGGLLRVDVPDGMKATR